MNVDELLSEAIRFENAGARAPAVELLGQVLAREPRNFDALLHLGSILCVEGHLGHAVAVLNRALAANPTSTDAFVKLGDSYLKSQRAEDATAYYRRALELDPEHLDALRGIGFVTEAQGRLDEAAVYRERHLAVRPDSAEALQDLGRVLGRRGETVRAAELLRRGFALEPNRPKLTYELGVAEAELGRHEEAIAAFRHAGALDPADARAFSNLGRACMRLGRWEEALDGFVRAAALAPTEVRYHRNVGAAMVNLGRRDEALARFDEIIRIDPENADAHVGRAFVLLLAGDFQRGWQEYEWRWRLAPFKDARFGRSRWNGSNLAGRSILVSCEQGLGDAIQFIRYIPMLKAQGATVVVSCPPELASLFGRSPAIDHVVDSRQPPPATHVYAPLLSLPALFRTDLENMPAAVPYLFTAGPRVVHWKQKLVSLEGLKVGIAWKGNPEHLGDLDRSIAPDWFAKLAAIPGVTLISLQKGEAAPAFPVTDLADQLTDFAETGAIMKNLDLVIAVDTAVAHLAGALGIPVWVALPFAPDQALAVGPRGQPVVSDDVAGSPGAAPRLAARLRPDRGRSGGPRPASGERVGMKPGQMIAEADRLLQLGQRDAAAAMLRRVVELRPNSIEALPYLAQMQAALGWSMEALASYKAAARLAPTDIRILNNIGALLLDLGQADEAIGWYRKALAFAPNDVGVLDNLGTALRKTEQLAEAVACHQQAIRLAPTSARSHNHLGVSLMEMDRTEDAIASYRRSLALDPSSHRTHNNLALAFKAAGRREESLAGFQHAAMIAPGDAQSLRNFGIALYENRRFEEALGLFHRSLELDPNDVETHFYIAVQAASHRRFPRQAGGNTNGDLSAAIRRSRSGMASRSRAGRWSFAPSRASVT